jgi:carbon storage regulator
MLVLSRYRDESIYIGDDVVITVVDIRGDRVRIGIQAPSDVSVHRQEIYEAIKNENRESKPAPKTERPQSAPFSQELGKRKTKATAEAKALPVDLGTPVGFGGLTDIVPQ